MKSAAVIQFESFRAGLSLALTTLATCVALLALPASAQTYTVIHAFTGGADGAVPQAGVTLDRAGNLYGTTGYGSTPSTCQCGNVFKMTNHNGTWTATPLYQFAGGNDGYTPLARVVFGPDGRLYGTTVGGGLNLRFGTVFVLSPLPNLCRSVLCYWRKTSIYEFQQNDGRNPNSGDLVFDTAGNLYGVTNSGGSGSCNPFGCGVVYEVTRTGGSWTETVLYSFESNTGNRPWAGIVFDSQGRLYGTNSSGGTGGQGTVYELTHSGGTWTGMDIVDFPDVDGGQNPQAGLTPDGSGNFFGATFQGLNGGTLFELTPTGSGWNYQVIYTFPPNTGGPYANITVDSAGNIYGTTLNGGAFDEGTVFKLTRTSDGWSYASLHDFQGGADGDRPASNVSIDSGGNLYGTTQYGGMFNSLCESGCGVVWEITP